MRILGHSRTLSVTAALIAACGAALPAGADAVVAESDLVVEARWWLVEPRGAGLDYAFIDDSASLSGGGRLQALEADAESAFVFRIGWRFGAEDGPELSARFWELETDFADGTGTLTRQVGALLASPDFAIGRSLVDRASAFSQLRASTVDVTLSWTRSLGDHTELGLELGGRAYRYEQVTVVDYRLDSGSTRFEEIVNRRVDARGVGPLGAVRFGYRAGPRVSVRARLGLAAMFGDVDATATDTSLIDGSVDRVSVVDRARGEQTALQLEGSVFVDVRLSGRLDAYVGYAFSAWPDIAVDQRFVDDVSQNTTLPVDRTVTFHGLWAGLSLAF